MMSVVSCCMVNWRQIAADSSSYILLLILFTFTDIFTYTVFLCIVFLELIMLSGSCLEGNISMCVGRHRVWFDGCCYIRH